MDSSSLDYRANRLVKKVIKGCENHSLGSATVAIYDTAWVAMISKVTDSKARWVFPECFQFLLDSQLPDGGWESHGSNDDGILNTMVALLAMIKHKNAQNLENDEDPFDLETRIEKAKISLEESLQQWDVESAVHVGFEMVVPALLKLLETEKVSFIFPQQQYLEALNEIKLREFDPETLYNGMTTMLHSLEAFIGRIAFDKISHHKRFGSMMASPASTAAYLMHCSIWDNEAESYIRKAILKGGGKGSGGLPSVFPTPIFEVTWVLSTLLQNGFSIESLGKENLERAACYLQGHLQNQQGLLGFAPSVLADADDTAKAILTLNLLERATSPDDLIEHFNSEQGHFRTYLGERDASFSANCNVLNALLHTPDVEKYQSQISTIAAFLSDSWWGGAVKDKWNISLQYPMMLLTEALSRLLHLWDQGLLKLLPETLLRDRIPVVFAQILNRTLLTQRPSGAWNSNESPEITAYAVLTLTAASSLPWHVLLDKEIISAIQRGRNFLRLSQKEWAKPGYLWVEKVTYGSPNLSKAYCLAALKPCKFSYEWSDRTKSLAEVPEKFIFEFLQLFTALQVFQGEPLWKLKASAIEGYMFLPQLKSAPMEILQRQKGAKNEYLNYIPCTWTIVNNQRGLYLGATLLWDMMVLTMCNFRVDEYMETAIAKLGGDELEAIKSIIRMLCRRQEAENPQTLKRPHEDSVKNIADCKYFTGKNGAENCNLVSFKAVIGRYVRAMLDYPRVQLASTTDQSHFHVELEEFLLSHIVQLQDNARFSTGTSWFTTTRKDFSTPRISFFTWAHTIGAISVSCPFSFAFFTCILRPTSLQSPDCFSSVRQKYLAADLCSHLAVMSRLYNDYSSISRDHAERNINSINFPEFRGYPRHCSASDEELKREESRLKPDLLDLAQYERECANEVAEKLVKELSSNSGVGKMKAKCLMLFVGVVALYADIYVAKDLSNPNQRA